MPENKTPEDKKNNPEPDGAWRGLAVIAVIIVVGFLLMQALSRQSRIEDCLLAHGRNCDELVK